MNLTAADIDFVARTVMAEAEGEEYEGKVAVAAVIYNRARHPGWWGVTIIDACLTSQQFSAWNDDNPRRNRIGEWDLNHPVFRECMRAAVEAFDRDPTHGADHYFAHDVVVPSWAINEPKHLIGNHTFIHKSTW
jgi:spore germination cell wall hydrolase CwlJ-like protein